MVSDIMRMGKNYTEAINANSNISLTYVVHDSYQYFKIKGSLLLLSSDPPQGLSVSSMIIRGWEVPHNSLSQF